MIAAIYARATVGQEMAEEVGRTLATPPRGQAQLRSEVRSMSIPPDVDLEAIRLFAKAGWPWDNGKKAFVEARQPEREATAAYRSRSPRSIGYGDLRDHGLAGVTSLSARAAGLVWLRRSLGVNE